MSSLADTAQGDLLLGIDTGGTFTDGVLLDERSRRVLASTKSLTTPDDLCRGINSVLDNLDLDQPRRVRLVGISSTLATNAIAEGMLRDVGLLLIGYDRDLVTDYELDSTFEARAVGYFHGGHTSQGVEQAPLDRKKLRAWAVEHMADVEAFAVSSYFSPLDSSHEEQALDAIREVCSLPVVLGHQLSTRLDSIKRAATACLNASLVAAMHQFIEAVRGALGDHDIQAPLMVLKGDGSLITYDEAVRRPVETVLSGPAASAVGGRFLTGHDRALVVDVGGTTTDIALIEDGGIALSEDGVRIGEIETAVRSARVRTACLGCDSQIAIAEGGEILIGPDRVIPLSRLADAHPDVERELLDLGQKLPVNGFPEDLEYWVLRREPGPETMINASQVRRQVVERLRRGPAALSGLLHELDVLLPIQLDVEDLLRRRVIERASLTPTDLLHVEGQLGLWSVAVASSAVECTCAIYGLDSERFVERALEQLVAKMLEEVIVFLASSGGQDQLPVAFEAGGWGRWFFDRALRQDNSLLEVSITSKSVPLVGVGAPADLLARRVAEKLRMPFALPRWSSVANAVGAVAGSVVVSREAIIYRRESESTSSYIVHVNGEHRTFKKVDDSLTFAEQAVRCQALEDALEAGAVEPHVSLRVRDDGSIRRVEARAIGNPGLASEELAPRAPEEQRSVFGLY